ELHLLVDIEKLIGRLIERRVLAGHEPGIPLPEAALGARVPRPKVSRGGGGGGRRGGGGGQNRRSGSRDGNRGGGSGGENRRPSGGGSRRGTNTRRSGSR
ncbi:MAG: hypothetical protein QNK80_05875, partial [Akkermansiaceae bacterium]